MTNKDESISTSDELILDDNYNENSNAQTAKNSSTGIDGVVDSSFGFASTTDTKKYIDERFEQLEIDLADKIDRIQDMYVDLCNKQSIMTSKYRELNRLSKRITEEIQDHSKTVKIQDAKINNMYSSFITIIAALLSVSFIAIGGYAYISTIIGDAYGVVIDKEMNYKELGLLAIFLVVCLILVIASVATLIWVLMKFIRNYIIDIKI